MAATYYTLLTKIGQASVANAVALNKPLNLTYMAVGDGNGNPTTPNENQTALVREKFRAQINQLTIDPDNPNYLIAEMIVPTTVGGWSIYEVGVFDDQSQLVAVANFPATYKPELAEGSGRDLIVRIVIQVSNTSVVTLKVDPAVILASQAWVAANYVKKVTVAGGTTGQVLAKKSNANEDFKWVDPTAAVQVIVDSQVEEQTLTSGQTVVDLAKVTTQAVAIYVEGVRLYPTTHYTINSPTRLTLKTSYPGSSKLLAVQNDPTSTIAMASLTERGFTQLSSATNSTSESLAATPKAVKAAYDLANGKFTAVDASLTVKGIVKLNSAINSVDETTAATPKAVKTAYDLANGKYTAQDASLTVKGLVQLSSATNSDSEELAATPKAVKAVSNGRLLNVRIITATGVYTPTPGTNFIVAELVGGGGGGGGAPVTAANQTASGGGGGGGGYTRKLITSGFSGQPITIGGGGLGATGGAASGDSGGNTTFMGMVAGGGGGGGPGTPVTVASLNGTGGNPGGASGGDVNAAGDPGNGGVMYSATYCASGSGGGNKLWPFDCGASRITNNNGLSAYTTGYGCGGGGGNNGGSQSTTKLGGSGSGGAAIIWEYA